MTGIAAFGCLIIAALAQTSTAGQVADAVVGKPNFTSSLPGTATATNTNDTTDGLVHPGSGKVFVEPNGALWVADSANHRRILRYNNATRDPFTNTTRTANLVLGQPNLLSNTSGNAANELSRPQAVLVDRLGAVFERSFPRRGAARSGWRATALPPALRRAGHLCFDTGRAARIDSTDTPTKPGDPTEL